MLKVWPYMSIFRPQLVAAVRFLSSHISNLEVSSSRKYSVVIVYDVLSKEVTASCCPLFILSFAFLDGLVSGAPPACQDVASVNAVSYFVICLPLRH
jgi:hypothetical protein